MYTIENDLIKVSLQSTGAELTGIYHKQFQLEYLWNADPAFWNKHSPVLFPIVGALKDNTYYFHSQPYQLPRHGFAREKSFSVKDHSDSSISFSIQQDETTLAVYPFNFEFILHYHLIDDTLEVSYRIINLAKGDLLFSVGGHPAFALPLTEGTEYEDYYIEFNIQENLRRWPITDQGLIEKKPVALPLDGKKLHLNKELFRQDAVVFKNIQSSLISLKSDKTPHGLDMDCTGFPFLGIWAAKGANFVCIEPWCGIADSIESDQQLEHKEGIRKLLEGAEFNRTWKLRLY